ncbi:uncharacterized protein L969DRAFT_104375 [Mixia osmundae IAM 14324]|uniref:non-specific serine/threonine protein kinase n=1 Tax=Mixia osmundae (strain CBS 9802 / IAM 14324 / JCM 22182 / KY 12970) TaxID=764103 RepID=G7E7V6_MIXOS|nr:uncharacterized protein L969DRAFT_104375 [Mixia osmundae IAM 14324]KEI38517.1 hypothetical protein L969DRAFT_104375 [Mixia osmundae IAM 14324]GAA98916.1 hypothetical protein E5Q_05604 [Mixia osmundae IAM 14324]
MVAASPLGPHSVVQGSPADHVDPADLKAKLQARIERNRQKRLAQVVPEHPQTIEPPALAPVEAGDVQKPKKKKRRISVEPAEDAQRVKASDDAQSKESVAPKKAKTKAKQKYLTRKLSRRKARLAEQRANARSVESQQPVDAVLSLQPSSNETETAETEVEAKARRKAERRAKRAEVQGNSHEAIAGSSKKRKKAPKEDSAPERETKQERQARKAARQLAKAEKALAKQTIEPSSEFQVAEVRDAQVEGEDVESTGLQSFPRPVQPAPPSKELLARLAIADELSRPFMVNANDTVSPGSLLDSATNAPLLSPTLLIRLQEQGLETLFAVQMATCQHILGTEQTRSLYPRYPPRDLCVNAPTGSGKTLAYVLPIVQMLSTTIVTRMRALIILPTRDLVTQVKDTFEIYCKGTSLRIGTATGSQSFKKEQAILVGDSAHYYPGGSSKVDILIATPGRLIDHLTQSPNLSLQHLRFLVMDEADRLLNQSFQDWLQVVQAHLRYPPPTSEDAAELPLAGDASAAPHVLALQQATTSMSETPIQPLQQILCSATLSRDPRQVSALNLRNPVFVAVREARDDQMDELETEDNFALPATLKEHMLVTSSGSKPLMLFYLLHAKSLSNVLCFTKSVESAQRLAKLVELFETEYASRSEGADNQGFKVKEFSGSLPVPQRKKILAAFVAGEIDMLICSDIIARGIDLPSVAHVISYDVPVDMRKYVHRVGRTARAGRPGDAWSLVESQEANFFKALLTDAQHLSRDRGARSVATPTRVQAGAGCEASLKRSPGASFVRRTLNYPPHELRSCVRGQHRLGLTRSQTLKATKRLRLPGLSSAPIPSDWDHAQKLIMTSAAGPSGETASSGVPIDEEAAKRARATARAERAEKRASLLLGTIPTSQSMYPSPVTSPNMAYLGSQSSVGSSRDLVSSVSTQGTRQTSGPSSESSAKARAAAAARDAFFIPPFDPKGKHSQQSGGTASLASSTASPLLPSLSTMGYPTGLTGLMTPPMSPPMSASTSSMADSGTTISDRLAPAKTQASQPKAQKHRPATTTVVPIDSDSQHGFESPNADQLQPLSQQSASQRSAAVQASTASKRASHQITSTLPDAALLPMTPSLVAAQASLSNGRPRVFFGPYQLLQTLGEGEFGKVKLGVHGDRWGEEVAIKLIKRGSVQESQARMLKVAREIEVLRIVKHPNIVRLYDVIETEKYIGIVLDYASGGELFDHILAHRYLKDRDASKLFAQLISGVNYMHAKKIVHRDLKLENLLLDRNRNIIITDFGFANRFENRDNDLMATSCGSPCYAAPELVVQDGKYVGTAVDVWSCGVILYAMLAGYLPFDDDPANPDGDNINLLYKYIISTPLSFPEWITPEPRDLLLRMLISDPKKRCTLDDVMRHPWLKRFVPLFERTVDELEQMELENEATKRAMLHRQRQILLAQQQEAAGIKPKSRQAAARHQSAMVTPTARSDEVSSSARPERPSRSTRTRAGQPQSALTVPTVEHPDESDSGSALSIATAEEASLSVPASIPLSSSLSAPMRTSEILTEPEYGAAPAARIEEPTAVPIVSTETIVPVEQKTDAKKAHRYTVQVEYDPARYAARTSSRPKPKSDSIREKFPSAAATALEQELNSPQVATSSTPVAASDSELKTMAAQARSDDTSAVPSSGLGQSAPAATSPAAPTIVIAQPATIVEEDTLQPLPPTLPTREEQAAAKEAKRRSSRRKAISMVVEPIGKASRAAKRSSAIAPRTSSKVPSSSSRSSISKLAEVPPAPKPILSQASPSQGSVPSLSARTGKAAPAAAETSTMAPSDPTWANAAFSAGNKAKRVMDWFRWRSTSRDTATENPPLAPEIERLRASFDNRSRASTPSVPASTGQGTASSTKTAPSPIVAATATTTPPLSAANKPDQAAEREKKPEAKNKEATVVAEPFNEARLRFHHGAVDQNAITSRPPVLVMDDVRKVLWDMGIEVVSEGDFKVKCVRKSRKKASAADKSGLYSTNAASSGSIAASQTTQKGVGRRGSVSVQGITTSPSIAFRTLFGKSKEPSPADTPSIASPAISTEGAPESDKDGLSHAQPLPFYGDADSGDECRFAVEITRMKNLSGLYSVDIRRLKGQLWGYKYIYQHMLDKLNLGV